MEVSTINPLHERFVAAIRDVAALPRPPDRISEVQLHALLRQATEGDCRESRPANGDIGLRFRHDAWCALRGTSAETAMARYVAMAEELTLVLRQ
jgi:acyl-CoA-binding protein